jgi:drug/metabolite transporter (DMT)-like permease
LNKNISTEVGAIAWLTLLFLSIIWGSSFILIKKALISFTAIQVAALRVTVAATAFLPLLLSQYKNIDWKKIKLFAIVGLTGSGVPAFLYATAQTEISSSMAGLLNSLTPIFTMLFGVIIFKILFQWSKLWGVLIGFIGASMLLVFENFNSNLNINVYYGLFIVLGTMCYATSVNLVKEFFQNTSSVIISAVSFFLIGPPAAIILYFTDVHIVFQQDPGAWEALMYIILLALFGTVMSTIIFFKLVQDTNAVFGSSVSYIIPIVAIGWGFVDGEILSWYHLSGMALILLGVYLIRKS